MPAREDGNADALPSFLRQIAAAPPCTQKAPAENLPETSGARIYRAICEELDTRQGQNAHSQARSE